jgi:hypothetical protein
VQRVPHRRDTPKSDILDILKSDSVRRRSFNGSLQSAAMRQMKALAATVRRRANTVGLSVRFRYLSAASVHTLGGFSNCYLIHIEWRNDSPKTGPVMVSGVSAEPIAFARIIGH